MPLAVPPVIAHRGASAEAPENTLAAFRRALEVGARAVELDVHLTADGVPVVIHDETLDRTTTGAGPVGAVPLDALRALDAGRWFHHRFAGERVPTLEEALDLLTPRAVVKVELKTLRADYPHIEEAVAAVVDAADATDRVVVSSFNPYSVQRFRELRPGVPTVVIIAGPLSREEAEAYQAFADGLAVSASWLRRRAVEMAQALGYGVVAWKVNSAAVARRLLADGVDAVITKDPASVLAAVGGHGAGEPSEASRSPS